MNRDNQLLVTSEPVEFEKRLQKNYPSFQRILWDIPQISKAKPKDHHMEPAGLGNTLEF